MTMPAADDPALQTLFLPFIEDRLQWPKSGALFLRARDGAPLHARSWPGLICEQSYKPDADALQRAGFAVASDAAALPDRKFPLVLVLPPRQRSEARALLARAIESAEQGGIVIAAMSNNEGAKSGEADLERLVGPLETQVKNKCRVFWTAPLQGAVDRGLTREWLTLDAVRTIENGRFLSRPGVFAWDRVDAASQLLTEHLPPTLAGQAADLGAGFGYLSIELLARCPAITSLHLYEAEARALELARANLRKAPVHAPLEFFWHDVTSGLPHQYDVIVTNPPFHTHAGRERPDVGRRFIAVAAQALRPGGRLWLVANRHLPYESVLSANFGTTRTVVQRHGYKIVEAIRSGGRA
jgi:16S rRNA (guanine1207-N2)-methyltransferase